MHLPKLSYLPIVIALLLVPPKAFSQDCGDERTQIILEYTTFSVDLTPSCSDFTQDRHSRYFSFAELNTSDYGWALIRDPLIVDDSNSYGLDRWRTEFGGPRTINSAYRNPKRNNSVGGAAKSRHMHGDAVDFRNESQQQPEWDAMTAAATRAQADFVESQSGPCALKCAHADWRNHGGTYQFNAPKAFRTVSTVFDAFRSPNWRDRMSAFYEFLALGYSRLKSNRPEPMSSIVQSALQVGASDKNAAIVALSELLTRENETVTQLNKAAGSAQLSLSAGSPALGSDEYFTYYGDLIAAVSVLGNTQTIASLVGAIDTGYMSIGALARLAPAALPVVTPVTEQSQPRRARSAVLTLTEMLRLSPELSNGQRQQLKKMLLRAIASQDPYTRLNAIDGLIHFKDTDVVSALEDAASHDGYEASHHGGANGFYPVRAAARKA